MRGVVAAAVRFANRQFNSAASISEVNRTRTEATGGGEGEDVEREGWSGGVDGVVDVDAKWRLGTRKKTCPTRVGAEKNE